MNSLRSNQPPVMYFAVIEATPKRQTEAFVRYGGSHVACWINSTNRAEARKKAIALIEGGDWLVKRVKEEKLISARIYSSRADGLKYFNQALIDGEVCVIYTYPRAKRRRKP
jgi:hypothetical protein